LKELGWDGKGLGANDDGREETVGFTKRPKIIGLGYTEKPETAERGYWELNPEDINNGDFQIFVREQVSHRWSPT